MSPIPSRMTAIEVAEPGGPDQLKPVTRDVPQPGWGEVLTVSYTHLTLPTT